MHTTTWQRFQRYTVARPWLVSILGMLLSMLLPVFMPASDASAIFNLIFYPAAGLMSLFLLVLVAVVNEQYFTNVLLKKDGRAR